MRCVIRKMYIKIDEILEMATDSYRNYPLRSLHEMCKSMDNLGYYKKIVSKQKIEENPYFDEVD